MVSNAVVNVFIPHLFDPLKEWHTSFSFVPKTNLLVPLLNQFAIQRIAQTGFIHSLYAVTGFDHSLALSSQTPPHAVACYYYDFGKIPTEAVLLATPIHLQTGMTDVTVDGLPVNDISPSESQALQVVINQHFQADGLRLEAAPNHSGRWYVLLPFELMPKMTHPVEYVLGNSLFPFLHHTKQLTWNRLLNELQMLLHTAAVNQQRESRGERPVSSFWLWGNAQSNTKNKVEQAFQHAVKMTNVDHIVAGGFNGKVLSHMLNATWHPHFPEAMDGNMMLIIDDLVEPSLCNDVDQWQVALTQIETNYIKPLMQQRNIKLILHSCDGQQWQKRQWYQRLWLRKKKTLIDYAL